MSIQAERYSSFTTETNIPITDFLEAGNTGPLNIPDSLLTEELNKLQDSLNVNLDLPNMDFDISALPNELGTMNTADSLTTSFINQLNADVNIQHMLSDEQYNIFSTDMLAEYNKITGAYPASEYNNSGYVDPSSECSSELNALLDMLNRLTDGAFTININLDVQLAAFIGLLNRLICGGVDSAFSGLSGLIEDTDTLIKAGTSGIESAAFIGNPNAIIDISQSPIGSDIISFNPDISDIATGSLLNYDINSAEDPLNDYNEFINSLSILDPNWYGSNVLVDTSFGLSGGSGFLDLTTNAVSQNDISITDSNTTEELDINSQLAIGLSFNTGDIFNDIDNEINNLLSI